MKTSDGIAEPLKVSKMRWVVLFISVLVSACGNMQWMQYGIIGDVITLYYGVSFEAVNWSSMVFLLVFVILLFPVSYILDKYNLRVNMILATVIVAIGAWIKVGSISQDRYWVLLLGQIVVAIAVVPSMILPPKVAAVWFPAHEVSSASGIGVAGIQIGFAIGIVTPPLLIRSHSIIPIMESDLFTIALGVAIISTAIAILVIICFRGKPETPPSIAAQNSQNQETMFLQPIKKLITNRSFVLLFIVFGIDFGVLSALLAMLNQIVLAHYPDGFEDAGFIGILAVVVGIVGSMVSGIVLDKFRCYKALLLVSQVVTLVAMVCFTYTFEIHISLVYITMGIVGFSSGALWSGNVETVVETTYPQPEGISIGLLNGSGQGLSIALTYLYQTLFTHTNDTWANNAMSALLLLALIVIIFLRVELRRGGASLRKDTDNLGFSEVCNSKV